MKVTKKYLLIVLLLIVGSFSFYYLARCAVYIYNEVRLIFEPVADRSDYSRFTTPLPADVIADLCLKFEISPNEARCQSGATVFGPDFFADIKGYLENQPEEKATYHLVQDKLGAYLVRCEEPNSEGHYRCRYDLQGDNIYPIFVYFTQDGYYYRIIANTGGS